MKLLALDTATEACSAALLVDGEVHARYVDAGRSHTQQLLPMVRGLMAEAGLAFAQLDGYVCGVGPGSFAGVRIGVGYVKGLALAHERPVVAVSSLAMLALPPLDAGAEGVLVAIDARLDEVYYAAYRRGADGLPQRIGEELVMPPASVPRADSGVWHAVGSGWGAYAAALQQASGVTPQSADARALPRAEHALRIAEPLFVAGETITAAALVPCYLRNKVALTLVEQQARKPR